MINIWQPVIVFILVLFISACGSVPQKSQDISSKATQQDRSLAILKSFPKKIEGFSYQASTKYPKPLGYSSRYQLDLDKRIYADVYSYPVPPEALSYSHKNIVKGMTRDALGEIKSLKIQGVYSKADVLKRNSFVQKGRSSEKIDIRLGAPKIPIDLYSILFLTAKNRDLLKIRLTMPYTESNIKDKRWQLFSNKIFSVLDKP